MTPINEVYLGTVPLLLKLEEHTPSGSHKDRPTRMITDAFRRNGKFQRSNGQKPMFIVPSSGNFVNGFAFHTQRDDVDVIGISDALSSIESQEAVRKFRHVRLEVVNEPDESGSHMKARMALLEKYVLKFPHATVVNQYRDPRVPLAYELTLAREIDDQLDGQVGAVFLPVGTGGMLNGILKYVLKYHRRWKIFAVDARGSRLFWHPNGCKRHFPAFGNGQTTDLIEEITKKPYSFNVCHIDDLHTAATCHRLLRKQNVMLGPSGGATVAAVQLVLDQRPDLIPDAGHLVAVIPDSGRKYLSNLYCDNWLIANGLGKVVGWAI